LPRVTLLKRVPKPVVRGLQRLARNNSRTSWALKRMTKRLTGGPQHIAAGPAAGLLIDVAGSRPSDELSWLEGDAVSWAPHLVAV
jgi:hypothetical protein